MFLSILITNKDSILSYSIRKYLEQLQLLVVTLIHHLSGYINLYTRHIHYLALKENNLNLIHSQENQQLLLSIIIFQQQELKSSQSSSTTLMFRISRFKKNKMSMEAKLSTKAWFLSTKLIFSVHNRPKHHLYMFYLLMLKMEFSMLQIYKF